MFVGLIVFDEAIDSKNTFKKLWSSFVYNHANMILLHRYLNSDLFSRIDETKYSIIVGNQSCVCMFWGYIMQPDKKQ